MGQNKTMACKSLIKVKSTVFWAVLFFILSPVSTFALNSSNVMLSSENQCVSFGGFGTRVKYNIELDTTESFMLSIYDKDGNLITNSVAGEIEKESFPIKIKADGKGSSWRINLKFIEIEEKKEDNTEGLLKNIDNSIKKLGDKLDKLNKFLSDKSLMEQGISNLKNSVSNLQSKFEPSLNAQTSLKQLGNVSSSSSSSLEPIEIEFAKGVKFNVFDLSKFGKEIKMIRLLMVAIVWIEFTMFCIKIIVPKFKV